MRLVSAIVTFTLFAVPAMAEEATDDHLSEKDGVRVLHAWANATDGEDAFLYLEIENEGDVEVTLVGAATDMAEDVHLIAIPPSGDAADMQEIESLPIPAGAEMELAPGGVAFELHGLTQALVEGEEFDAIFSLDPIGELEVHVEIEASDATQHSHAGHNH